jgi:predicted glycosyltransferase involved in capsule biosynthesis
VSRDRLNYMRYNFYRKSSPQISLLVPFRAKEGSHRDVTWRWLKRYWQHQLPDAEIVIGKSHGRVFSKTEAVNSAARKAHGRIFVIIDADCYMDGQVIQNCADAIEKAQSRGHRRWFIPYRALYRLTEEKSAEILKRSPKNDMLVSSPPPWNEVESTIGSMHGRRYGALIQIVPREAFELVRGMDPRFRGWGGEDVSFARAVDTLYNNHKTSNNDVLTLWHPKIGTTYYNRQWGGQTRSEPNKHLATRYSAATGDRARMRKLVDETL